MTKDQIIEQDLSVMEQMAAEMEAYLMSECTHWVMGDGEMPPLTIGGYLMRYDRLMVLCKRLKKEDQVRVRQAGALFDEALKEKVVRFEARAHQELHAFISEWVRHLKTLASCKGEYTPKYPQMVDTRVVIDAIIKRLEQFPYQLDRKVAEEVSSLDKNLRGRWQKGAFVWHEMWQPAYPQDEFWWLYGQPS